MPNTATAMETFNGRLYVYSENETYIVNPDGMFIEDTIKGIGCRNQNSVIASVSGKNALSEIPNCFRCQSANFLISSKLSIGSIGALYFYFYNSFVIFNLVVFFPCRIIV